MDNLWNVTDKPFEENPSTHASRLNSDFLDCVQICGQIRFSKDVSNQLDLFRELRNRLEKALKDTSDAIQKFSII